MAKIIPTYPKKAQRTQRFTFGGRQWLVRYTWRQRPGAWYFDLFYADGTPAMLGRRLIGGMSPDANINNENFPPGKFFTYGPEVYTRYDLGQSLLPMFVPTDEIPIPPPDFALTVLEGDHSPPFVPIDPPEPPVLSFCAYMAQTKEDFDSNSEDFDFFPFAFFVYACEECYEGDDPYVQLDNWKNDEPFEGSINLSDYYGELEKAYAFNVGDIDYVKTDKEAYLESSGTLNGGDEACSILYAFRIRNVPNSTKNVFRIGTVAKAFRIRANSDQTLTISGIATDISYELDKIYIIYAFSNDTGVGTDTYLVLDDTVYVSTIDAFDVRQKTFRLGDSGDENGLELESICILIDATTNVIGTPDDIRLTAEKAIEIAGVIAEYYPYDGGMNNGFDVP